MKTCMGLILLLAALCFAEPENYTGYGDTANIATFAADSLKYSKAFLLSPYDNTAFIAATDDTTSAGYASDSINYIWGIQNGDIMLNANGKPDTTWRPIATLDTIDTMTSADFGDCDTAYVTGFCVQDRNVAPEWSVVVRFWCKGLAGNKIDAPLKQRFAKIHRAWQPVRRQ